MSALPNFGKPLAEWLDGAMHRLDGLAGLRDNWDAQGSPKPSPAVITAARRLLARLDGPRFDSLPAPFVCPVAGGGIQIEWTSARKHLEIEFLDARTIAFLQEERTPQGESTKSGEYPSGDVNATRLLLEWFVAD